MPGILVAGRARARVLEAGDSCERDLGEPLEKGVLGIRNPKTIEEFS